MKSMGKAIQECSAGVIASKHHQDDLNKVAKKSRRQHRLYAA